MGRKPTKPQPGSQEETLRELKRECNEAAQDLRAALGERQAWLDQRIADYVRREASRALKVETVGMMAGLKNEVDQARGLITQRFDAMMKFLMDSEEVDMELLTAAYRLLKDSGSIQEIVDMPITAEDLLRPGVRHVNLPVNPNSPGPHRTGPQREGRNRKGPQH